MSAFDFGFLFIVIFLSNLLGALLAQGMLLVAGIGEPTNDNIVITRLRRKPRWSRNFDCCQGCGTRKGPCHGHGMCQRCYTRQYRRSHPR